MWEIGVGVRKKYALVITPEQHSKLMPIVQYMMRKAPILKNWEFHQYRLPSNPDDIVSYIDDANDKSIIQSCQYTLSEGDYGTIDIKVFVDEHTNKKLFQNVALNLRLLLGDERFEKWVGYIDIIKTPVHLDSKTNNKNLVNDFDKTTKTLKEKLPNYYSRAKGDDEHTLFELQPSHAKDYKERSDMFSCVTRAPEIISATFAEQIPFYSERFTKNGETFLYLKIDTAEKDQSSKLSLRHQIEDNLDETLIKNNLGCVIGGGSGIQYIYIDLLVKDNDSAIPRIQQFLKDINLTKRSWFLFHDADLQKAWIGVYKETPPPHM